MSLLSMKSANLRIMCTLGEFSRSPVDDFDRDMIIILTYNLHLKRQIPAHSIARRNAMCWGDTGRVIRVSINTWL